MEIRRTENVGTLDCPANEPVRLTVQAFNDRRSMEVFRLESSTHVSGLKLGIGVNRKPEEAKRASELYFRTTGARTKDSLIAFQPFVQSGETLQIDLSFIPSSDCQVTWRLGR